MTLIVLKLIIIVLCAYLIGSIPTGWIIVKLMTGKDIRKIGSGSTGATNVKRVLGTKWFFIVMLLDALKGFLPVWITVNHFDFYSFVDSNTNTFHNIHGLSPAAAALAIVIGHSKSVFLDFTGGKSAASGIGTLIALSAPAGLLAALIWGVITYFTKYVSAGSIIAVTMSVILMQAFSGNDYYVMYAALCAVFVIIRHKDNIIRLIKGAENKVR